MTFKAKVLLFNDAVSGKHAVHAAWNMYIDHRPEGSQVNLGKVTLSPNKKSVHLFVWEGHNLDLIDVVNSAGKQFLKDMFLKAEKSTSSKV